MSIRQRARLITGVAAANIFGQLTAFVAGVAIIRVLVKADYAQYAIAVAAVGAAAVLTDSGVNATLIARLGKKGRAADTLAEEVAAAERARRVLVLIAVPPLFAITAWLLLANGTSVASTVELLVGGILTVVPDVTSNLLRLVLQVTGRVAALQWLIVGAATARVVIVVAMAALSVAAPSAYVAAGAIIALGTLAASRRMTQTQRPSRSRPLALEGRYRRAIAHTLPESLALALWPQVFNGVLTAHDNTTAIADIAALSRLAAVFAIVNAVVGNIAAPRLALGATDRRATMRGVRRVTGLYALFSAGFVLATAVFAPVVLRLLGPEYEGLGSALVIIAAGTALANFAIYGLGGVSYARGWTAYSWTYVPLLFVCAATVVPFVDLTSTTGAAWLYASAGVAALLGHVIRFAVGYSRSPN